MELVPDTVPPVLAFAVTLYFIISFVTVHDTSSVILVKVKVLFPVLYDASALVQLTLLYLYPVFGFTTILVLFPTSTIFVGVVVLPYVTLVFIIYLPCISFVITYLFIGKSKLFVSEYPTPIFTVILLLPVFFITILTFFSIPTFICPWVLSVDEVNFAISILLFILVGFTISYQTP